MSTSTWPREFQGAMSTVKEVNQKGVKATDHGWIRLFRSGILERLHQGRGLRGERQGSRRSRHTGISGRALGIEAAGWRGTSKARGTLGVRGFREGQAADCLGPVGCSLEFEVSVSFYFWNWKIRENNSTFLSREMGKSLNKVTPKCCLDVYRSGELCVNWHGAVWIISY